MSIVSEVKRLHRAGKYRAAVELLETNVLLHRDDSEFLLQLALSYIYTQDYKSAQGILDKVIQVHPGEHSVRYLNAVIAMLNQNSNRALDIWISVLRENSSDSIARRGLGLLKSQSVDKVKHSYNKYSVLRTLIPKSLRHSIRLPSLRISIGIGLFLLLVGGVAVLIMNFDPSRLNRNRQLVIQDIPIQYTEMLAVSKESRYQLSDEEINGTLESIRLAFNVFDDTEVCRMINYLLHSNISDSLHNKLISISQLLRAPTFISLTESAEYAEVYLSPWLYHTCYIRWSGRAVKVQQNNDGGTQFLLYVGYEDTNILEGIISSTLAIEYDIKEEEAIEIIGMLSISGGDIVQLEIIDVRPLYR